MSNLLPIAAAKVLKVPVIVFTSLQHFPIVPVVPSDAIIIGSCIHVAYNAAGFGGFYDVGTYVSSSIVLPKLMTDPVARRRDSRKRYREKMALLKVNQPAKKRGKKPKTAGSQEENHEDGKPEGDVDDSVASQHDDSMDVSLVNVTDQDKSIDSSVQEGQEEASSGVVNDIDEGAEAAANLLEMAYSEAGMNEETMEESTTENAVTGEILPATEPETKEDLEACLQNPDLHDEQITTDPSETAEMVFQGNVTNAIETTEVVSQGTVASAEETSEVVSQKRLAEGSTAEAVTEPVAILAATDPETKEDLEACLQNSDPQDEQITTDPSETPDMVFQGNVANAVETTEVVSQGTVASAEETSEVVSQKSMAEGSTTEAVTEADVATETIAEDVINQAINGEHKESEEVDAGETPEPVLAGNDASSADPLSPKSKSSVLNSEMVLSFQEGVNIQKQTFSCSCGRGSGKNLKRTQFCLTLEGGYLTRCACYRNASGCSHRCRCYLCCNPYGTAQAAKATKPARQVRRFRPRHKVQVIKSRFPSLTFTSPLPKSDAQNSKWLEVDSMAFECLIATMSHAGLELTPENIAKEFARLCTMSQNDGGILGNTVQSKMLVDITHQLEVVQKNIRTFENLYKKQTELNWFQGMEVVFSTEVVVSS